MAEEAAQRLGRQRVPCWILLSAGVVLRAHTCRADGSDFMTFGEAARAIPELVTSAAVRRRARLAWQQVVADLRALDVLSVAGEATASAFSIWRGGPRGDGSDGCGAGGGEG